jgi:hypothetical protein
MSKSTKRLNRSEAIELIARRAGCSLDDAEELLCGEMMIRRLTYDSRDRERPFYKEEIDRLWPQCRADGRPPKIPPDVLIAAGAFFFAEGLPEALSSIEAKLKELLSAADIDIAESTVRKYAEKFRDFYTEAMKKAGN